MGRQHPPQGVAKSLGQSQAENGSTTPRRKPAQSKGVYTLPAKADYQRIMGERMTLTTVWDILKAHVGIEDKPRTEETDREWEALVAEAGELYKQGETPAQKILAQSLAHALMDYYRELVNESEVA